MHSRIAGVTTKASSEIELCLDCDKTSLSTSANGKEHHLSLLSPHARPGCTWMLAHDQFLHETPMRALSIIQFSARIHAGAFPISRLSLACKAQEMVLRTRERTGRSGRRSKRRGRGEEGEEEGEEEEVEEDEDKHTVTASTGSSTLRTWSTKRELGRTMRPPTIPPKAAAQGSNVAHPEVITCRHDASMMPQKDMYYTIYYVYHIIHSILDNPYCILRILCVVVHKTCVFLHYMVYDLT